MAWNIIPLPIRSKENFTLPQLSARRTILLVLALFLLAVLFLVFREDPRRRLNVLDAATVLFFLVVLARTLRFEKGPREEAASNSKLPQEFWVALLLGAGLYATALSHFFIADDFGLLEEARQPVLAKFWNLLTEGMHGGDFLRPVTYLLYFLDYRLWGTWPAGFHLTNLLLHLATVAGIFFLGCNLGFGRRAAAGAALIFSVLPVHAEAVAWMAARFDLLAACLMVWAFVLYLRFQRTGSPRVYLLALAVFLLAMLSKESAYVLPLLLLAAEFLLLPKRRWSRWKPWLGFAALAALTFAYRWMALGGIAGYVSHEGQPAVFMMGPKTLKAFFIRGPAVMLLGYNWSQPSLTAVIVLASLAAALLVALAIRSDSPWRPGLLFGVAWIVLCNLPVHPLLYLGPDLLNTRVLYLNSVGAAFLVGLLLAGLDSARLRQGFAALLVLALTLGLLHNLAAWRYAGRISRQVVKELQQVESSPPKRAEFVFHQLPVTIRGAFFVGSLSALVRFAYDRPDVSARRAIDPPRRPQGPTVNVVWRGERDKLIELVERNKAPAP